MTDAEVGESRCWYWLGTILSTGYGQLCVNGRKQLAHRFIYEKFKSLIPVGMTLDHLCRNRACVNPSHLEIVTMRENVLRGEGITAKNIAKTHCKWGHKLFGDNLYTFQRKTKKYPERQCKQCKLDRQSEQRSLTINP